MHRPMQGPQALAKTMSPNSSISYYKHNISPSSSNTPGTSLLSHPPLNSNIYSPSKSPHSVTSKLSKIFRAMSSPSRISFVASPSVVGLSYSPG